MGHEVCNTVPLLTGHLPLSSRRKHRPAEISIKVKREPLKPEPWDVGDIWPKCFPTEIFLFCLREILELPEEANALLLAAKPLSGGWLHRKGLILHPGCLGLANVLCLQGGKGEEQMLLLPSLCLHLPLLHR